METTPDAGPITSAQAWRALAVLVLPVLLISMDATILGFAIPELSESIAPTSSQLLWIIDIYSFVLAGLLVTMGVVGDRVGRRRLLMWGSAGFTVASLAAAFSTSAPMLIGARALLGVAGATLMPSTLSLIRNVFVDDRQRQTAIAVWAAAFGVGSALGPIVGGFLLEHFWWGSVFLIGAPITGGLLIAAPRLVPESRDPAPGRFDLPSAGLSIAAMLPAVYGVKVAAEHGIGLPSMAGLAIGVAAGVAFVRRQRTLADPMIDVSLFSVPRFRMAVSGNLAACFGLAGSLYAISQHLQLVMGYSPLQAGLRLLPAAAISLVFTLLAPTLARRFGPFAVISGGLAVGAAGFAVMAQLRPDSPLVVAVGAVVLLNAGLSAALTVAIDGILASLPPERAGAGASVSETANELGIALGTALVGSIVAAVYRSRIDVGAIGTADGHAARETLGGAVAVAERLGTPAADAMLASAQAAFNGGVRAAAWATAGLVVILAGWAAVTARRVQPEAPPAAAPETVEV